MMPPRKKSKAPLIITLVAVLILLGGVGTALLFYLDAHEANGTPHTGDELPALCSKVSEATLAKARTTNPNGKLSSEHDIGGNKTASCDWRQTEGKDGEGMRGLTIHVEQGDADEAYNRMVSQAKANTQGQIQDKALDIGDESTAVLLTTSSAFTSIDVIARKGDTVVEVDYIGWDVGLFSPKQPDVAALEEMAKSIAAELLDQL